MSGKRIIMDPSNKRKGSNKWNSTPSLDRTGGNPRLKYSLLKILIATFTFYLTISTKCLVSVSKQSHLFKTQDQSKFYQPKYYYLRCSHRIFRKPPQATSCYVCYSHSYLNHQYSTVQYQVYNYIKYSIIVYWFTSNKVRNRNIRAINGNNLTLLHLNKGSSSILSKISIIKNLIFQEKADIISLNESNCNVNISKEARPIDGFEAEHKLLTYKGNSTIVSRTTMLIRSGLEYTRMGALENDINSIVWIKIILKNGKPLLVCSGYRQWTLPATLNHSNSNKINFQRSRFESYLKSISLALKLKMPLVILHDSNIDISSNNNHNIQYNIKDLYDKYRDFLIDNDLTILNNKFTRYAPHQAPSTLDHVVTNTPAFMGDVQTKHNIISDHCSLTVDFLSKTREYVPRFKFIRNWKLASPDSLRYAVSKNINLQNLLQVECPDKVAETLQEELNKIINELAPEKRVMINKTNQPYLSADLQERIVEVNGLLTAAIASKDRSDWRLHNHKRNILYKDIDKAKTSFIKSRLTNNRHGWKEIKKYNGIEKAVTPSRISHQGQIVTSPKVIAEIANSHYINKVINLAAPMETERRDPVKLLNKVIPRSTNCFKLKYISMRETFQIIRKLPNTNSTGVDSITNRVLKSLGWSIVPQLCHMINCVIRTSVFPSIFKQTRIIPVSKPGKPADCIDSYRPINNLPTLEKILQQWIKICLVDWLEETNTISGDHHGGRRGYSTLTAITKIKQQINSNLQNKSYNILLTTDLSAAFDTIDHMTLMRKMDHHGIRGKELRLFGSYLEDRSQIVEIESFRSKIQRSPDMSCIQGSKLANTIYTIYNLEVPVLQVLLNCPHMLEEMLTPSPTNSLNYNHPCNTCGPTQTQTPEISAARRTCVRVTLGHPNGVLEHDKCFPRYDNYDDCYNNDNSTDNAHLAVLLRSRSKYNNYNKIDNYCTCSVDHCYYTINNFKNIKQHGPASTCEYCTNIFSCRPDKRDHNHYLDACHEVSTFVDDTTSNIAVAKRDQIEPYIKIYLELMYNYYSINFLTLNRSKTKYCIVGNSTQIAETRNIKIKIDDTFIHCDGTVRILGHLISSDTSLNASLNELISNLNWRLYNLGKIKKYTDFESRRRFILSFVVGKLNYLLPLFYSAPKDQLHKLHLIYVKACKISWGVSTFRVSNKTILTSCGLSSINAHIQFLGLMYIHKMIYFQSPLSIINLLKFPSRFAKDIIPKERTDSKATKNFFLYKLVKLYNGLKTETKALNPIKFKVALKKIINYEGIPT